MTRTPCPSSAIDFGDQRMRVEHDAVADDGKLPRTHDPGGQQPQLEGDSADDQRVAGIMPALEAHHDIGALRQPVDDLAFPLVPPLRADDYDVGHEAAFLRVD